MADGQEPGINDPEVLNNYFKNTKEWFELIKWIIVFVTSVFIPILGLMFFWIKFQPMVEVFAVLSLIYLAITLVLIKPLVENKNDKGGIE